jgi:hypothetical protein
VRRAGSSENVVTCRNLCDLDVEWVKSGASGIPWCVDDSAADRRRDLGEGNAPTWLITVAMISAARGASGRVDTDVAIALAAPWNRWSAVEAVRDDDHYCDRGNSMQASSTAMRGTMFAAVSNASAASSRARRSP